MCSLAIALNFGELFHDLSILNRFFFLPDFLFFVFIFRAANNSRISLFIINIIWGKNISRTVDKLIREFKHDVYRRRQTAKITSEFVLFSCNP